MEETQYYKMVYSKYWKKQTKVYGYAPYEKSLVKFISQSSPKEVFEVGIGTGWPIGAALKREGIKVDGCDIAESSVQLAIKELDNADGIWNGNVLEYKDSKKYDVTYCVRASWYIPDFYKTIRKMCWMTKPGGYIIFDIMDENSAYCKKVRRRLMVDRCLRFLGIHVEEKFGYHFMSVSKMKKFLKRNGLKYRYYGERELTKSKDMNNTPKVVFVCRKKNKR